MPLTVDEAINLTPRVAKLVTELREALSPDGENGKRITRSELRAIIRAALALVTAVVVDVLD